MKFGMLTKFRTKPWTRGLRNDPYKIVLDTNVLLVSISSKSKYHWIFKKLLNGDFELFISNEILLEYEEIIGKKYNKNIAKDVRRVLLLLPNVHQRKIYYNWQLIENDPDDNKFIDCAVASNADYIVTEDKDFSVLSSISFPQINTLSISGFRLLI